VLSHEDLLVRLNAAVAGGEKGLSAANRLCHACVELLDVDGAAISLMLTDTTQGTFGSSSELSRRLDELQFTFGEGPCMDAVGQSRPILVADLRDPQEQRWPAYAGAVLESGVRAVFAFPVEVASSYVGALDLFRNTPGPLTDAGLAGGLLAAELAALPLLDLMASDLDPAPSGDSEDESVLDQLASLARVEVYQATGMLMGQLDVGPAEALVRLRAHAFANGLTASDVAWAIVERRLSLDADAPPASAGEHKGRSS
jgi:hypothetical protein